MTTLLKPYKEERPWGNFIKFSTNQVSTVKLITVNAQSALSLQSHTLRDEFWHIISGEGTITIEDEKIFAKAGDNFSIARQKKHRVETSSSALVFLEIALGEFDENDIMRFDDIYGRISR